MGIHSRLKSEGKDHYGRVQFQLSYLHCLSRRVGWSSSGAPLCSRQQADGPSVTLWGTGNARREFLHVGDLAYACLLLLRHFDSPEIINVGSGFDSTIRELAETVTRIAG